MGQKRFGLQFGRMHWNLGRETPSTPWEAELINFFNKGFKP